MLHNDERNRIYHQAYLPEHVPDYVTAISGAQPHLHDDFLCYSLPKHLIFIGYPLGNKAADTPAAYASACKRFRPHTVALIAPKLWAGFRTDDVPTTDCYFRLDLPAGRPDAAVAYMVRRAQRELQITEGNFGEEHRKMVQAFISSHDLVKAHQTIFERIGDYLQSSKTARLLEARKRNRLVAFTVIELGSADYAYYMFNFRSSAEQVPGASDCLFHAMVAVAEQEGKKAINLGLSINSGIRRFKEKWGGRPFLTHTFTWVHRKRFDWKTLLGKF